MPGTFYYSYPPTKLPPGIPANSPFSHCPFFYATQPSVRRPFYYSYYASPLGSHYVRQYLW